MSATAAAANTITQRRAPFTNVRRVRMDARLQIGRNAVEAAALLYQVGYSTTTFIIRRHRLHHPILTLPVQYQPA